MQFLCLLLILLLPGEAAAHVGVHGPSGLSGGLLHPFSGVDHILAMLAVGIWGGWQGGRHQWLIPAGFVAAAAAGFLLGIGGGALFGVIEQGIALSLVGLGALLFFRARLTLAVGLPLVALFGLFHGLAHGSEVAMDAGVWLFMTGFLSATLALHLIGLFIGGSVMSAKPLTLRIGGAAIAMTGVMLVVLPGIA